jgi:hypothetical protein
VGTSQFQPSFHTAAVVHNVKDVARHKDWFSSEVQVFTPNTSAEHRNASSGYSPLDLHKMHGTPWRLVIRDHTKLQQRIDKARQTIMDRSQGLRTELKVGEAHDIKVALQMLRLLEEGAGKESPAA